VRQKRRAWQEYADWARNATRRRIRWIVVLGGVNLVVAGLVACAGTVNRIIVDQRRTLREGVERGRVERAGEVVRSRFVY
jgi:hypothetical protein